jgi:hypothetical protein
MLGTILTGIIFPKDWLNVTNSNTVTLDQYQWIRASQYKNKKICNENENKSNQRVPLKKFINRVIKNSIV